MTVSSTFFHCVLAPVIFNLFLVAITLAFRHGVTMEDAVGINYRLDGNLFNVRRLQAKTQTNSEHVFADDAALPSHSAEGLQRNLDNISATYKSAGLLVNVKKTEVMTQPPQRGEHSARPVFSVNDVPLTNVEHFTYLGSVLSADCDITHEVQQRIKSASAVFGRLSVESSSTTI